MSLTNTSHKSQTDKSSEKLLPIPKTSDLVTVETPTSILLHHADNGQKPVVKWANWTAFSSSKLILVKIHIFF